MPPKPKYTREEIVIAALDMVREVGIDAVTARELGSRLGTSARPIFTAFENMDDLKKELKKAAFKEFEEYAQNFQEYTPAFKKMGMLVISYAMREPQIYKLLFMQEGDGQTFQKTIENLGNIATICLNVIQRDYGLNEKEATILFDQTWVYAYGLSTMCAMKVCTFSEDEISEMLTRAFMGTMFLIKSGKINEYVINPKLKKDDGENC